MKVNEIEDGKQEVKEEVKEEVGNEVVEGEVPG